MRSKIVRTIFKKEIIDIIRDKKTLFMGIVLPLILYPLLMIIMTQIMTISMNSIENDYINIAFEKYPSKELITLIKNYDSDCVINIVKSKNYKKDLEKGNIDAYVDIKEKNKIENQLQSLKNIRSKTEYIREGIKLIEDMIPKLDEEIEYLEIMGIEGNAARVYFPRIFDIVQWKGRKPRIKNDYINTTLDIGYTMLFNIVDAILQVYGFDTYYGVFHKCFYMRKSLVCDIMEPMRPIIDCQIRKAINLGQCKQEHFVEYNHRWVLKYKQNPEYIRFLMKAILEYKDEIFLYIQNYYRYFMKKKSVTELPRFSL